MHFIEIIIIIILIIIVYKYVENHAFDVIYVKSTINDKEYLVRNLPDKQEAADLLASIGDKLERLIYIIKTSDKDKLYDKYINTDLEYELYINSGGHANDNDEKRPLLVKKQFKADLERLVNNFNPDNFSENTPDSKYTSYSVNKGEKIVFCIRDKNREESMVKENIMLFVAIHELAHLMTKSIGHGQDFWTNFKVLLKIAINNGIYQYINFNTKSEPYCGTYITDSPLKPHEQK